MNRALQNSLCSGVWAVVSYRAGRHRISITPQVGQVGTSGGGMGNVGLENLVTVRVSSPPAKCELVRFSLKTEYNF